MKACQGGDGISLSKSPLWVGCVTMKGELRGKWMGNGAKFIHRNKLETTFKNIFKIVDQKSFNLGRNIVRFCGFMHVQPIQHNKN